jgi:SNF2 family DNA or RNA helicase
MKLNRTDLKNATKTTIFRQAERLAKQGAVTISDQDETTVRGTVRDYALREVEVVQSPDGELSGHCTCFAYVTPCAHVLALLLAVLEERQQMATKGTTPPTWEGYLMGLPELPNRSLISRPAQVYKLLFFIQLKPAKWMLQPTRVYIKKDGTMGQRALLSPAYVNDLSYSGATPAEMKAINYLAHRPRPQANPYSSYYSYYPTDQFEFDYGEDIGHILDLLSDSDFYYEEKNGAPVPIKIVSSSADLFFQLTNGTNENGGQEQYRFLPQLQFNGHPEALDDTYRILASRPFWLLRNEKIFRVENPLPAAYLLPFTRKNYHLQIPKENVGAFLQGFLPHLRNNVNLVLPETLSLQTARELTGRRLYLQEANELLRVALKFAYGEVEVDGMSGQEVSIAASQNAAPENADGANGHANTVLPAAPRSVVPAAPRSVVPAAPRSVVPAAPRSVVPAAPRSVVPAAPRSVWRVERDHAAEAAAHEALVATGLMLDASKAFYAPVQEPLPWLFDELPKLAAAGFEIFGEENLKRIRVNRSLPNVRVAVSSGIDWFDTNVEIDFGGVMLSLMELRQAVRKQSRIVKLADGSLARLPEEWEKRFRHFFNFAEVHNERAQIASAHAMLIDALFDEVQEKRYDDDFKQRLIKLSSFNGIQELPVPENFRGVLRPYQQAGLNWLGFLKEYGFNGCLADDMGLGKTVQALAFLLREKSVNGHSFGTIGDEEEKGRVGEGGKGRKGEREKLSTSKSKKKKGKGKAVSGNDARENQDGHRTSLIVAPLSVLFNWEKECARFAPDLKILIHHGLERRRAAEHFAAYDIVLTSYATMRLDVEFMKDFAFHYIILDESQNIKNPISQTAKAATILKSNHRLVLTGTPVENNTVELWSQFSFLNPGMLGSLNYFRGAFSLPIERHGDEASANLLKKMISPFLLRRTKEQVVHELPPKSEQIFYCAMTDSQKKLYNQVRDQYRAEIMNLISTTGLDDARFKVLQGLTKLRQIACHPGLIFEGTQSDSGKFESFLDLLREILAEGHKVLVFSQFVRMLKIVAETLKNEKITFEVLTGATRDREAPVKKFQEDPNTKVFLISLKAGGLGLNLTAADYVMIYDPWWNPAAERQAIDRAHRIGQTKNVFSYKMITRDTVEEKILELQQRKSNLVSQLISTEAGLFKHLTAEDIRGLFS